MTTNWIVVYSTTNNREWQSPNWMTVTEVDDLSAAHAAFENFSEMAHNGEEYREGFGKVTQAAIFKVCGKETFQRKPRYHADCRDKSDWAFRRDLGQIGNALNSDFSLNIRK